MSKVTLSTGEDVHIKDVWNHGLQKKFDIAIYSSKNEAEAIYAAYEAVYPDVIEKIEKDGQSVPYSIEWLYALTSREDYKAVRKAVDGIGEKVKKKVIEKVKSRLFSKIGSGGEMPMEYIEWCLCRELHCMPEDLDKLSENTFRLWLDFLGIESEAAKIRQFAK